jgi:hypothetical protein
VSVPCKRRTGTRRRPHGAGGRDGPRDGGGRERQRGRRGTQGYSRGSSRRYLKRAHGSTWGTQSDSGALNGRSTTHAPDGATVGTKVVGASVLFMGEGVGAGVNSGIGAGVTTVGVGVGGAGGTAQRWTARQIGRCEYPRSTPPVEPVRREQCRAVPWTARGTFRHAAAERCTRTHTTMP